MSWSSESSRVPEWQQRRDSLNRGFDRDGATPSTVLDLLDTVTQQEDWDQATDRHGEPFGSFTAYMTAERPEGFGFHDKDDLRKHLDLHHKEEKEPYLREATVERMAEMRRRVRKLLGKEESPERGHGGDRRSGDFQAGATRLKNQHNTSEQFLARLKREDPGMAQRVIDGELSANEAALAKKWRYPRIVVSTPKRVVEALRNYMTPDDLAEVARLIQEG